MVLTAASQSFVSRLRQARYASSQPAAVPEAAPADASTLAEVTATPVNLTGSDLLDIPEQIGFLKTLGLDYGWGPTSLMQTLLESTYVYTGLPWWASIGLVALAVRLTLLKPTLDASENAQRLQDLQKDPRYAAATDNMKKSLLSGNHLAGAEARHKVSLMNKEAGYKPWKNLIGLIQIPIGIGMFRLIKGMAALPVPSFETGGFLWFTDLTVSDPYFLLPILTGIVFTNAMRVRRRCTPSFLDPLLITTRPAASSLHGSPTTKDHEDHDCGHAATLDGGFHLSTGRSATLLLRNLGATFYTIICNTPVLVPSLDWSEAISQAVDGIAERDDMGGTPGRRCAGAEGQDGPTGRSAEV